MDIPAGFDQWQWQQQPINHFTQVMAYRLADPEQPNWSQLNRWYPECTSARLNNYWVCPIGKQTWSFFEYRQGQWVLMPITSPTPTATSPLPLGLDLISATEQNGYSVWLYFSNRPLNLLKRQLQFRLGQRIVARQSLDKNEDLWLLAGDDGRLVFSEHGDWTFVALIR